MQAGLQMDYPQPSLIFVNSFFDGIAYKPTLSSQQTQYKKYNYCTKECD
jgi:hypothetical protein